MMAAVDSSNRPEPSAPCSACMGCGLIRTVCLRATHPGPDGKPVLCGEHTHPEPCRACGGVVVPAMAGFVFEPEGLN